MHGSALLCLLSRLCGFLQELGGGGWLHRCPPHPALPAALPALPDPPCSIAAAAVHICPCARSYLLRLKPALQHCESSLRFINFLFFFFFFSSPPLLLCFLAQNALKLCSFFQHFSLSQCPPLVLPPCRSQPPGAGQSPGGGWAGSSELPWDQCPAWLSQMEAKSIKAHTISKQWRNYRSRVGS